MRIGLVSPFWPPHHGGIAVYAYRLARALRAAGCEVEVFCATPEDPARDNGDLDVTRCCEGGLFQRATWLQAQAAGAPAELGLRVRRFFDAALAWARAGAYEIVLVNAPLTEARLVQARELFLALRARGVRVGALHHDLGDETTRELAAARRAAGCWERAAQTVAADIARRLRAAAVPDTYRRMGSPLFFAPDFVVSCSVWSDRFVDPLGSVPRFVLHPLLDAPRAAAQGSLPPVDVLMVNPQKRKAPVIMANLVADAAPGWTFRVLKGGWGDAFGQWVPLIENTAAHREGRVALVDYVPSMAAVFAAARLTFFPSRAEGYGLVAAESLAAGVPVVASSHPAILEAVGDAARLLCPFEAPREAWRAAVAQVLAERRRWSARGAERAMTLRSRGAAEIAAFVDFLRSP
ncbi:MAG: glycosyltransferase [Gammaproteobacteria bacterium]|nr:glycosyltransferase [Gammaproteobacteria bacterium]